MGAAQSASRLLKSQRAGIGERVAEISQERARIRAEATRLAIEHSGITQARGAVELGRIAFANLMDYMRIGPSGDPVLDFSNLTREQASALTEVTVDDYIDGRGENARDVRKVKFKLADKRAALMDIAKLFGWITERRDNKDVDEFDTMTEEQLEAWLDERAEARVKARRLDAATSGQHGRSRRVSARSVYAPREGLPAIGHAGGPRDFTAMSRTGAGGLLSAVF